MKLFRKITLLMLALVLGMGLFVPSHATAMSPGMDMDHCPQQIHCQACSTLPAEDISSGQNFPPVIEYVTAEASLHSLVPVEPLERPPQ